MCQRNESHGMINLQQEEFSKWIHMTKTVAAGHICAQSSSELKKKKINKIASIIFSAIVLKLYFIFLYFLQEKQFYAEFILLHIHESETEKKWFRYFPSVTWLSQNLKRHKVDSAGPSKCDLKKKNKIHFSPCRRGVGEWHFCLKCVCSSGLVNSPQPTMKHLQLPGGWLAEIHFQTCQENRRHCKSFFPPALSHLFKILFSKAL